MKELDKIRDEWLRRWPEAIALWSRFTKLSEPRWCFTKKDEEREHLASSFAMIRLFDHAVVISLDQVVENDLQEAPTDDRQR